MRLLLNMLPSLENTGTDEIIINMLLTLQNMGIDEIIMKHAALACKHRILLMRLSACPIDWNTLNL